MSTSPDQLITSTPGKPCPQIHNMTGKDTSIHEIVVTAFAAVMIIAIFVKVIFF
jgi:hypothetical protein